MEKGWKALGGTRVFGADEPELPPLPPDSANQGESGGLGGPKLQLKLGGRSRLTAPVSTLPSACSIGGKSAAAKMVGKRGVGTKPGGPVFGADSDDEDEVLDPKTREAIGKVVIEVGCTGPEAEDRMRVSHKTNPAYWWMSDKASTAYRQFRKRLEAIAPKVPPKSTSSSSTSKSWSGSSSKSSSSSRTSSSSHKSSSSSSRKGSRFDQKELSFKEPKDSKEAEKRRRFVEECVNIKNETKTEPKREPEVKREPVDSHWRPVLADPAPPVPEYQEPKLVPKEELDAPYDPFAPIRTPSPPPLPSSEEPKKKRSRWGVKAEGEASSSVPGPSLVTQVPTVGVAPASIPIPPMPMPTTTLPGKGDETREETAVKMFGRTELTDKEERELEAHLEEKREEERKRARAIALRAIEKIMPNAGEDILAEEIANGASWEHIQRKKEMEQTRLAAEAATAQRQGGGHHMVHFLPPEELARLAAERAGQPVDRSEYQQNKLQADNKGFQLLAKMGWEEGAGLGPSGQGITAPVAKGKAAGDNAGLGLSAGNEPSEGDDEFDAYRKRMMLAYRFRPNPLNNPRRPYY